MNHRRVLRFSVLAVAAGIAAPLSAQSPLPAYAPLNSRYRIVSGTHASQIMMGQAQESDINTNQLMSVAVAKDGAGLALTITLDSVTQTSTGPAPLPDLSDAFGLKLTGAMAPDGHVISSTVTDKAGKPSESPIAGNMRSFLPRLKIGAKPGASWADTTEQTRPQGGGTVSTSTITTYTLVGDTTMAGAKNWKLSLASTGTISGNGNQNGADFTIKGDMTGAGTMVVGAGGALLGADLKSDIKLTVDVPMAGMQIPITQKQTTLINRVP